jgi:hypothetical protein
MRRTERLRLNTIGVHNIVGPSGFDHIIDKHGLLVVACSVLEMLCMHPFPRERMEDGMPWR